MNSATECPFTLEFVSRSILKRDWPRCIIPPAIGWFGCLLFLLLLQGSLAGMVFQTEQGVEGPILESKTVTKGPVEVKLRLSPAKPRLSDTVQLEVVVAFEKGVEVKPPAFGQAVGDFIVRNYRERKSKSNDTSGQDAPRRSDRLRTEGRVFQYDLEPTQSGRHLVRSIDIEFVDQRKGSEAEGQVAVIESETLEVEVVSEWAGRTPDLDQLDPMFEPRPIDASSPWKWLGVALPILAIGLAAIWWLRKKQAPVAQVRQKSPTEIAQESLAILLLEKLPEQGRFQEFYLRLTGIVRVYIEGTTGVKAPEQTTEEFLGAMKSQKLFSVEQAYQLQDFLEAADMVKYAGQSPTQEQVQASIERAREFVSTRFSNPSALPVGRG